MIERLRRALEHIDKLSPEQQERIAQLIEDKLKSPSAPDETEEMPPRKRRESSQRHQTTKIYPTTKVSPTPSNDKDLPKPVRDALGAIGAWSDLKDDEFEALDRIRHESMPTPPVDEQLAWLDDE